MVFPSYYRSHNDRENGGSLVSPFHRGIFEFSDSWSLAGRGNGVFPACAAQRTHWFGAAGRPSCNHSFP